MMDAFENISLYELIQITEKFLVLAKDMYDKGTITEEEYNELTFLKKDFIARSRERFPSLF